MFREPGYDNTSNPYVGRILEDTQPLVDELETLCGQEDTVLQSCGGLVLPLMYRRALPYDRQSVSAIENASRRLRAEVQLGGVIMCEFGRIDIKPQYDNHLFSVRVGLEGEQVRPRLIQEHRRMPELLPDYMVRSASVPGVLRVLETPSLDRAHCVASLLRSVADMEIRLQEPHMHFTAPNTD